MVAEHVLSFDVENWYDGNLHREWTHPSGSAFPNGRLPGEVDDLLDLLESRSTIATFFILGRVAVDDPDTVRRIAARGHEIACHAMEHVKLSDSSPGTYLAGLRRSRALLQDLSGQPVLGHRAPSWSLDPKVPWAVEALVEAGFTYDSSIFPMRTPLYGVTGAPCGPFWLTTHAGAAILELPPAVRQFGPLSVPYGGGIYWRVLPFWVIRLLLATASPGQVTYLHPWELNRDTAPVPANTPLVPRLVLRYGVRRSRAKLSRLLAAFTFQPMSALAGAMASAPGLPVFTLP